MQMNQKLLGHYPSDGIAQHDARDKVNLLSVTLDIYDVRSRLERLVSGCDS